MRNSWSGIQFAVCLNEASELFILHDLLVTLRLLLPTMQQWVCLDFSERLKVEGELVITSLLKWQLTVPVVYRLNWTSKFGVLLKLVVSVVNGDSGGREGEYGVTVREAVTVVTHRNFESTFSNASWVIMICYSGDAARLVFKKKKQIFIHCG